MIKYKELYSWDSRGSLGIIEKDDFEPVVVRKFRIEYEGETWAFPLSIRWYKDMRYKRKGAVAISVLCIHFIFEKYEF